MAKQQHEAWVKFTAKVTHAGGLGGIGKDARLSGVLSLGSTRRTGGEKCVGHWRVLEVWLGKKCQKEEIQMGWRETRNEASTSKKKKKKKTLLWVVLAFIIVVVCFCFLLQSILDLYLDLIANVLISFTKSIYEYTVLVGELALWP